VHTPARLALLLLSSACSAASAQESPAWAPASPRLMTRWAAAVTPDAAHREYPRPQMVRERWLSLNGLWDYAITAADAPPGARDGRILVPFPLESALSGVARALEPEQQLVYRRTFQIPQDWSGQRIRLHFGAVDWSADVRINSAPVGTHTGGYDPFWFDITAALHPGDNELLVIVRDPTDAGGQPRGKQVRTPDGIWYTRSSGIWQSVWLEPVAAAAIDRYTAIPDLARGTLTITTECSGAESHQLRAEALIQGRVVALGAGAPNTPLPLAIPDPHPWSPDDPFLYDLRLTLLDGETAVDTITGYFALRDIRIGPDEHGITRILLNGKPLFQFGPLDQGFWPDGLYTAPTDEALKSDIEVSKQYGCNMLRKHVKVEPDRFYSWCDRLGMLVWQDIPSASNPPESRANFEDETAHIIRALANHPSIIMWVPFNEGWGQHDTPRIVEQVRKLDPSRLVNNASGWTDSGTGDVNDIHAYPGPASPWPEPTRAAVLGEFGGLGLPLPGHLWVEKNNWGYVSYKTPQELTDAYVNLLDKLHPLITQGLSAAVYTQTTDVEIEVNGWLTYDRAISKIYPERASAAARRLYEAHGSLKVLAPAAPQQPVAWRYTLQQPPDAWTAPEFDAAAWQESPGGFGTKGTPGAIIGTDWNTSDIWIRRTLTLPEPLPANPQLLIHHDEDAEVYLNGTRIAELKGYTTGYITIPLSPEHRQLLRAGENTLALHCRQTRGGQYIDAGLADLLPPAK
jgi:hypothetical protein